MQLVCDVLKMPDVTPDDRIAKLEATWIVTNLAYGNDLSQILDEKYEVMKYFNKILEGNDSAFIEQILYFLSNVAGENRPLRDYVLSSTIAVDCCLRLQKNDKISRTLLKVIVWLSNNLSRYSKFTNMFDVQKLFEVASTAVFTDDDEIKSEAMWVLAYLTDTSNE